MTLKQLLNEWSHETNFLHEVSEEERIQLHKAILDMYIDIRTLCETHNLSVMLAGGSCLGAVRHKGFIPWDDDLDLMMPRADYNKLIDLLKGGSFSDRYQYRYPDGKKDSSSTFLKVYKKGTVLKEIDTLSDSVPNELFLDFFPIESASSFFLVRKFKAFIANGLRYISNCVCDFKRKNEVLEKAYAEKPELQMAMKRRFFIGKCFSIIDSVKWRYWYDKFVSDCSCSQYMCIPSGRLLYEGELLPSNVYLSSIKVPFENTYAYIPKEYDRYLENLYGNYMQIPPVEKRECHFIAELKL